MSFEQYFQAEDISRLGVNLTEEQATQLSVDLGEFFDSYNESLEDDALREFAIELASLSFVAGRAFQADQDASITIELSREAASAYIEYLTQKAAQ